MLENTRKSLLDKVNFIYLQKFTKLKSVKNTAKSLGHTEMIKVTIHE